MTIDTKKTYTPSVTVLIPLYNTPCDYLYDLLLSLQEQIYKNFDVLIVDDHSNIDYSHILRKFIKSLDLRYIKTIENIGMVNNWNYASSLVKSDYFIMMGHDDILTNEYLLNYMENVDDETVIISSSSTEIDSNGSKISRYLNVNHRSFILKQKEKYTFDNQEEVAYLILRNGAVFGELPCLMVATNKFNLIGGYDSNLNNAADIEIIIRLIKYGKLKFLNKGLLLRRFHSEQKTFTDLKTGAITRDRNILFDNYKHAIKRKKIHLVSASIILKCIYDIFRLPIHKSFLVVIEALKVIYLHLGFSIIYLPIVLYEVIIRKNLDEM